MSSSQGRAPAWPNITAVSSGDKAKKQQRRILFSADAARRIWGVPSREFRSREETPDKTVEWSVSDNAILCSLNPSPGRGTRQSRVYRFAHVLSNSFSLARTSHIDVWWKIRELDSDGRLWLDPEASTADTLVFVPLSALPEAKQRAILEGAPLSALDGD